MKKTVGIVAGSISGNKGAEAMATTVIRNLSQRIPEVRFVLFSPYPKADIASQDRYANTQVADSSPGALVLKMFPSALLDSLFRLLGLKLPWVPKCFRLLRECDLIVDVAGISFSDGREKYLPFNVLTILPAMMSGIGVAKMSQAMGPFKGTLNRLLAKWLLPKCRYLAPRGQHTADNLRDIGLPDRPICPDLAFLLNGPEPPEASLDRLVGFGTPSRRLVGISPSSVVYKNCRKHQLDYLGIHARFIRHLVDRGYRVLLVPHSIRVNTDKLKNNDLPVLGRLIERLDGSPEVSMIDEDLDSVALRKVIGQCDFFLASRFHSMIAALATGVPTIVCGWGHKYFEILDMFGLREYAFDYRQLSLDLMIARFDGLVDRERQVRQSLQSALPTVLAAAGQQLDVVVELLESGICRERSK